MFKMFSDCLNCLKCTKRDIMTFKFVIENTYDSLSQSVFYVPKRFYTKNIELDYPNGLYRYNTTDDGWQPIPHYKEYSLYDFAYNYEYDYCYSST